MFKAWYALRLLLLPAGDGLRLAECGKPVFDARRSDLLDGLDTLHNFPLYSKQPGAGDDYLMDGEMLRLVAAAVEHAGP